MFQITVTEKIKAHTLFSVTFSKNRAVYEIKSKNIVKPERTQTIWRLCVAYWISKPTRAQIRACARAPTPTHPPTRTRARTHTHTHIHGLTHAYACPHSRASACTDAEICNTSCFPRQQLRYTYSACLVDFTHSTVLHLRLLSTFLPDFICMVPGVH